jgi:uncharacterized protein (TIGR00251 family)
MPKVLVLVKPNAKSKSHGIAEHQLWMRISAPAVDGKANQAAIEYFSEITGQPKSTIQIVAGNTSRLKTFESSMTKEEVEKAFVKN